MLVVDTGVLVAAADRTDSHHTASAAIIREDPGPLVTTAMVIAEAAYLLDRELGPAAESALYTSILDGDLMVEPLGSRDWHRIRELVDTYADLHLGGTDASLIAIAERLRETRIATLNHRHFTVVRPAHRDAFDLLP
ncbi:MAG: PIN domain-containing protein [Acidimicrobiales bacterium]